MEKVLCPICRSELIQEVIARAVSSVIGSILGALFGRSSATIALGSLAGYFVGDAIEKWICSCCGRSYSRNDLQGWGLEPN